VRVTLFENYKATQDSSMDSTRRKRNHLLSSREFALKEAVTTNSANSHRLSAGRRLGRCSHPL